MKFFLDTADVDAIRELNELGMVDGVTTNPSLILKAGRNIEEVTREICEMVPGPVSAEVVAATVAGPAERVVAAPVSLVDRRKRTVEVPAGSGTSSHTVLRLTPEAQAAFAAFFRK